MRAPEILALCAAVACFGGCAARPGPATPGSPPPTAPTLATNADATGENVTSEDVETEVSESAAAAIPTAAVAEDLGPESPPTSGTCIGRPSKAALKGSSKAVCCYTPASFFQKHIHERWDEIQACYEQARTRNPKTHGMVLSKFTIEEDGSIIGACDAGSTVGDPKLVVCVEKALMKVQFPPYTAGDVCPAVTLNYPVVFRP